MLTLQVAVNTHSDPRVYVMKVPHIFNLTCPYDIPLQPEARGAIERVPGFKAESQLPAGRWQLLQLCKSSDGETRGSLASFWGPPGLPAHLCSLTSNLKAMPALNS